MDTCLAQLRKERNLSRAAVSRRLGLDESTVYLWEVGKRRPNGTNMVRLADLYDLPATVVLEAIERHRRPAEVESGV